eukprot:scaffold38025_cov25-Tisochrysis_lutea.AAC.1
MAMRCALRAALERIASAKARCSRSGIASSGDLALKTCASDSVVTSASFSSGLAVIATPGNSLDGQGSSLPAEHEASSLHSPAAASAAAAARRAASAIASAATIDARFSSRERWRVKAKPRSPSPVSASASVLSTRVSLDLEMAEGHETRGPFDPRCGRAGLLASVGLDGKRAWVDEIWL